MARWVTPSPASSSSERCSATGSGVVREPYTSRFGETSPTVPMLAAAQPSAAQIWRVKAATEVFPLVPVTAAVTCGCPAENLAAASARQRRGGGDLSGADRGGGGGCGHPAPPAVAAAGARR